ncbi:hypothetical protein LOC51_00675 [Rubrivivax sp. JA1024]|nr:hypothetical protein [Rubrivivax sp. JA1024]
MLDSAESLASAISPAMTRKKIAPEEDELSAGQAGQADRLKLLRRTLGYETAISFAAFLGLGYTTYHPFEKGQPLSREAAFRLVRKIPGLTLDWLYFGKPDGLPLEFARKLGVFGNRNTE